MLKVIFSVLLVFSTIAILSQAYPLEPEINEAPENKANTNPIDGADHVIPENKAKRNPTDEAGNKAHHVIPENKAKTNPIDEVGNKADHAVPDNKIKTNPIDEAGNKADQAVPENKIKTNPIDEAGNKAISEIKESINNIKLAVSKSDSAGKLEKNTEDELVPEPKRMLLFLGTFISSLLKLPASLLRAVANVLSGISGAAVLTSKPIIG